MTTLFVSDLHLSADRPEIGKQFCAFLRNEARLADSLYILGDLFEAWIGDDDPDPHYAMIQSALTEYAIANTQTDCWFMHGNRDFLIGDEFAKRTGFQLLDDPVVHELYGSRVLISHGDQYCTADTEYMAVRQTVRSSEWQTQVLSLPISARLELAANARKESESANAGKSMDIMDVTPAEIERAMLAADVRLMLHGHTHRPAIHELSFPDQSVGKRMVLGDWYTQGSVGVWDDAGFRLVTLDRFA